MKVLIAVGGGGHFSPALAVIDQMPKMWEVLLIGRKYAFESDKALSLEYQTAQRLHLLFEPLTTGRLQRKFTRHTLKSLLKLPVGLTQATKIVRSYKPDVVLSFGGYVTAPVVMAAAVQRIPIIIHEQTLHAGLANKIASRFATKICISWSESEKYFPKEKTVLTGNPLRKEFLNEGLIGKGQGESEKNITSSFSLNASPLIYITGGSGGAHGINVLVEGCLEKLLEKYTVIHQTGDATKYGDFARLETIKNQLPDALQKRYILKKFIDIEYVVQILSRADLVISRAGINTVTELLYLGKQSLLIPLLYGQHNEQLANATFMQKLGLAQVIDQRTTTPEGFLGQIAIMINGVDMYEKYKTVAQHLIHPDAAEKIIKEVQYAKEKRTAA